MAEIFDPQRFSYVVRTYVPIWRHEERLDELVRFCRETDCAGVLLWAVPQHMSWNQATMDEIRTEAGYLRIARDRLMTEGLSVGINSCYNFHFVRWDSRHRMSWDYWMTREDGSCAYTNACHMDPKLAAYLREYYHILAEVRPHYIFVDDDHRYVLRNRATRGCFCDLHLTKFSERTGRTWARQELADALTHDQSLRQAWIELLGDNLVELAGVIRETVHAVDSDIEVGMMMPCVHELPLDGHNLKNILNAFKGTARPLVRPCVGGYSDNNRRDMVAGLFYMELHAHHLGDEVQAILEGETTPFTRLSKSMTMFRFQTVQGVLNGINAVAASICGYVGDSPYLEPAFAKALKNDRSFYETVRRLRPARGTRKGIQFMWHFDSAKLSTRTAQNIGDLTWPAFVCHDVFGAMGFPNTYDESPIRMLAGDSVRTFSEERIREILAGGVMLEVNSALALQNMGFGEYLGCTGGENLNGFSAEECTSPEFCGPFVNTYIPLKNARMDAAFQLEPAASTRILSRLTDPGRKPLAPGVVLFENELGGKIALLPYSILGAEGDLRHLVSYHRRYMFKSIFDWMHPGALGLWVEEPTCFHVQAWDDGSRIMACLTNVSYDTADAVEIDICFEGIDPATARFVADDGNLEPLGGKVEAQPVKLGARWRIRHDFAAFRPFIMIADRSTK